MKTLIYDLEIIKCIPGGKTRSPEFGYCEGWRDVEIERATLVKLLEGSLINPNTGTPFESPRPLSFYQY